MNSFEIMKTGLLSIHGEICVRNDINHVSGTVSQIQSHEGDKKYLLHNNQTVWVSIEACRTSIIIRQCLTPSNKNKDEILQKQELTVQGSLLALSKGLILKLLNACGRRVLEYKPKLLRSNLTTKMINEAQIQYCGKKNEIKPLPGGWWFDGNVYLDISGNHRIFRPDIEEILILYLQVKNDSIDEYNSYVKYLQEYL